MKKLLIAFLFSICCTMAFAQKEIKVEDAAKYIGDTVKVCAKIFGARYLEQSKQAPTFLNAGAKYPDSPLTLVIFGENRVAFKNKPEEFYNNKQVCATGIIVLYKGKPEIILTREDQISINE